MEDSAGLTPFGTLCANLYTESTVSFVSEWGMNKLALIIVLFVAGALRAQVSTPSGMVCLTEVVDGDTLVMVTLDPAFVAGPKTFKSERDRRKYQRLERKVVKVYPYAYAAGVLMQEYDRELASLKTERERKKYLQNAEDALKAQFEGELRNMTVSEGVLLIKLIDRETGDTSYGLIQDLKGKFSAFMWQGVARLFGHNLKDRYDAEANEADIESIVRDIEMGILECRLPSKEELMANHEPFRKKAKR